MQLYRFSPITTEDKLKAAISYVIAEEIKLAIQVTGTPLPIPFLTIFAHYDHEYAQLSGIIGKWGETSDANNGVKIALPSAMQAHGQNIRELRIRKPDPYRMQVGCCDFDVDDYDAFKSAQLGKSPNLRLIERPAYEMIEFFDPDVDVLAYVVSS